LLYSFNINAFNILYNIELCLSNSQAYGQIAVLVLCQKRPRNHWRNGKLLVQLPQAAAVAAAVTQRLEGRAEAPGITAQYLRNGPEITRTAALLAIATSNLSEKDPSITSNGSIAKGLTRGRGTRR
jgi:hypothetical protein